MLNGIEEPTVRKIGDTGNLAGVLRIEPEALVMLTSNINIEDRLVNGLVGKIARIGHESGTVEVIYVKFNDQKAGSLIM